MPNETNKIDLPQLRYAIELMCAGTNPITPEQLEDFCHYPGGPILPDQCVESRRLPGPHRKLPELFGMTPQGELIYRAHGGHGYSVGSREYAMESVEIKRLLGCVAGGPVLLSGKGAIIHQGKIVHFDPDLPHGFMTSSGRILIPKKQQEHQCTRYHELVLDEAGDPVVRRDFVQEFLPGIGQLEGMYEGGEQGPYFWSAHTLCEGKTRKYILLEKPASVVRWYGRDWIFDHERPTIYDLTQGFDLAGMERFYRQAENIRLGKNPYLGGFCEVGSQLAYVGQSLRYKLECWVRAGVEQPAFERVTRELFEQDGKHYYYGQIGRHLYKMELPAV